MKVDEARHLLVVAGGFTGAAYFYDTRTGVTIANVQLGQAGGSLINDVVITNDAAYFTNSFGSALYRVPLSALGTVGAPTTLQLTGPAAAVDPNFPNLNGIAATADGSTLFVGHTVANAIYSVDPATGATALVIGGFPDRALDGILLQGRSLWAVANFANTVNRVTHSPHRDSGAVTQTITSDLFHVPTAVGRHGDRLALVNARFDLGFPPPFGPGAPAGTTFDVVTVRACRSRRRRRPLPRQRGDRAGQLLGIATARRRHAQQERGDGSCRAGHAVGRLPRDVEDHGDVDVVGDPQGVLHRRHPVVDGGHPAHALLLAASRFCAARRSSGVSQSVHGGRPPGTAGSPTRV
jgi:hypothetical protein